MTDLKVYGRWTHLYRAIDREGNLIDATLSQQRDMKTAKAFCRSAWTTTGSWSDRLTTDNHGSYRRTLKRKSSAGPSQHQGRIRCMRGFQNQNAADNFCKKHGERRNLLRPRRCHTGSSPPSSAASA